MQPTMQPRAHAAGVVGTWYYQTNNVPPNPTKEVNFQQRCSSGRSFVATSVVASEQCLLRVLFATAGAAPLVHHFVRLDLLRYGRTV